MAQNCNRGPAPLLPAHAGPGARRRRRGGPASRWAAPEPQQLRKPRLSDLARRWCSGGSEVLPPRPLERRADRRGARLRARACRARDSRRGSCALAALRRVPHRDLSAPRRTNTGAGRRQDARMDRALHRPHPCGRCHKKIRKARGVDAADLRPRAARIPPRQQLHSRRSGPGMESSHRAGPGSNRQIVRNRRRLTRHSAAWRLPCRQYPVDRRRTALRRPRRRAHGTAHAGLVDAALGRSRRDGPPAASRARGLRGVRRLRSARALSARAAAHAAPDPLLGVDRAALGRSGVPGGLPLVQYAALLAGPDTGTARADRADGRRAAGAVALGRDRKLWICATTAAPSPIAPPTRLTEPARTSPIANTPATLVWRGSAASCAVVTKPLSSTATSQSLSHSVLGSAPRNMNTWRIGRVSFSPESRLRQVTDSTPAWREPVRLMISVRVRSSMFGVAAMRS